MKCFFTPPLTSSTATWTRAAFATEIPFILRLQLCGFPSAYSTFLTFFFSLLASAASLASGLKAARYSFQGWQNKDISVVVGVTFLFLGVGVLGQHYFGKNVSVLSPLHLSESFLQDRTSLEQTSLPLLPDIPLGVLSILLSLGGVVPSHAHNGSPDFWQNLQWMVPLQRDEHNPVVT
ncbi:hypothetical protein VNI00_016529 [Paramarasmius palmivorus]|uniref:Uncharacterized protein n=1 Tax=Paramarasmius palmivorus TaxID=297713 RepID=A0AAW0BFS3_9AGAR